MDLKLELWNQLYLYRPKSQIGLKGLVQHRTPSILRPLIQIRKNFPKKSFKYPLLSQVFIYFRCCRSGICYIRCDTHTHNSTPERGDPVTSLNNSPVEYESSWHVHTNLPVSQNQTTQLSSDNRIDSVCVLCVFYLFISSCLLTCFCVLQWYLWLH